jgi:hypothetical protein
MVAESQIYSYVALLLLGDLVYEDGDAGGPPGGHGSVRRLSSTLVRNSCRCSGTTTTAAANR